MARSRQWYDDVMDVGLHATLKEAGFRRKSHTNYVCEHSPERTWVFEIEPWKGLPKFRDWTGIFVPEIEEIVERIAPEIGTHATFLREPTHFKASVATLVRIERGWDQPTWDNNPKSRSMLWGHRNPPHVTKAIPLCDGNLSDAWWDARYVDAVLSGGRGSYEEQLKRAKTRSFGQWSRDQQEAAIAVGHELDRLWRKHNHDWLQKCDNSHYLAKWFDRYVFSGKDTPSRHEYAATAAIAYHVAGDDDGAASVLNRLIVELETAYKAELAKEEARDRIPGPVTKLVRRLTAAPPTPPPEHDAATRARASVIVERDYAEAARKLAKGLGIRL